MPFSGRDQGQERLLFARMAGKNPLQQANLHIP
jgi:hypothetical protein